MWESIFVAFIILNLSSHWQKNSKVYWVHSFQQVIQEIAKEEGGHKEEIFLLAACLANGILNWHFCLGFAKYN